MASSLVLLIVSLCVSAIYVDAVGPSDCSDRQIFVPNDTGCNPSCAMPIRPKFWPCTHAPLPACVCKPQYLEADDGECVPFTWCPKRDCLPNQHFEYSTIGCEVSCDMPVIPPGFACAHVPIAMCVCNKGFYRSNSGACVKFSECGIFNQSKNITLI